MPNDKRFNAFLQKLLNEQGYKLDVDGDAGDKTREAIKDFQKRNGIKPDGRATVATLEALRTARKAPPQPRMRPGTDASPDPVAMRPMPGGMPPADDRQGGGFDREAWQSGRDAAAAQASPQVRAAMGYPPAEQIGTQVNAPVVADRFDPTMNGGSMGPRPPDIRTEGYGEFGLDGSGVSREAFTDAHAPLDPAMADRAAQLAQALSIRTGNSPLAGGDMPPPMSIAPPLPAQPGGPDFAQANAPPPVPDNIMMALQRALGGSAQAAEAQPPMPSQQPQGIPQAQPGADPLDEKIKEMILQKLFGARLPQQPVMQPPAPSGLPI